MKKEGKKKIANKTKRRKNQIPLAISSSQMQNYSSTKEHRK